MARKSRRRPRNKRRDFRRKGIYVLPNLITTASLFAGFYSIIMSLDGRFDIAALAIMTSLLFDGLDGRVARVTKSTSLFGVEYDSLADLVAFGVAPSIMFYLWALKPLGRLGWVAAFLFIACGALRLARFNVQTGKVHGHFVGLAIPAAASTLATTILFFHQLGLKGMDYPWLAWIVMFLLGFLMVSNIPYLSFKEMGLSRLKSFNWLVAALLVFMLVVIQPYIMGFILVMAYVLGGPLGARATAKREEAQEAKKTSPEEVTSA